MIGRDGDEPLSAKALSLRPNHSAVTTIHKDWVKILTACAPKIHNTNLF
jgi:hypothetical protein